MPLGVELNLVPGEVALGMVAVPTPLNEDVTWYRSTVDLGPSYIVFDGDPALSPKRHSSPLLLAHVCCGHSRPSQLLRSSCCLL